jgi:CubicO group peptidase (beta-lactamase class C family)
MVAAEAIWFAEPDVARGDRASIIDHLDSHLEEVAADRSLGSATLAVIEGDEIVFSRGYGSATAEQGAAVDAEASLFQVGSVSKAVTAVGAMKLVQNGRIRLDDPVVRYMKRWRFGDDAALAQNVTLRHLLSHTGGVQDPPGYVGFAPGERFQPLEEYLSGVRLSRRPGTEFVYGNSASAIVQLLIEDITGRSFSEYMRDEVLLPLGMTSSTYDLDTAINRLVPAFDHDVQPQAPRRHSAVAAVALYTNAKDLARFAQSFGRENSVLTEESKNLMMRPAEATHGGWGLGLALFTSNDTGGYIIGHDGGAQPAWGAMVRFNPETGNGMTATISGGRGAANQMAHDWVYWETGKTTSEGRRQVAYGRARPAAIAILAGAIAIILGSIAFRRRVDSR